MKIFLLKNPYETTWGCFTSAVVIAEDEATARRIPPSPYDLPADEYWKNRAEEEYCRDDDGTVIGCEWPHTPEEVQVTYMGELDPAFPMSSHPVIINQNTGA